MKFQSSSVRSIFHSKAINVRSLLIRCHLTPPIVHTPDKRRLCSIAAVIIICTTDFFFFFYLKTRPISLGQLFATTVYRNTYVNKYTAVPGRTHIIIEKKNHSCKNLLSQNRNPPQKK